LDPLAHVLDAMRALAALRLGLLVLVRRGRLVNRRDRVDVYDALRLLYRLACAGGGIPQPPDRGERSQHARSKRSGEGDSERARPRSAAMGPNTHLEPVDELAAGLGPIRPELGLEAALRISSPCSHSLCPSFGFFLAPVLPACLRFPYRRRVVLQMRPQAAERAVERDFDRVRLRAL